MGSYLDENGLRENLKNVKGYVDSLVSWNSKIIVSDNYDLPTGKSKTIDFDLRKSGIYNPTWPVFPIHINTNHNGSVCVDGFWPYTSNGKDTGTLWGVSVSFRNVGNTNYSSTATDEDHIFNATVQLVWPKSSIFVRL